MDANDYFIRLLKVSDSLGTIWELGNSTFINSRKILRVGDSIEYNIESLDPKNRQIKYSITGAGISAFSLENKIKIIIPKEMISKISFIKIKAETEELEYENSTYCEISYTILP